MTDDTSYKNWVSVFQSSTDYEADMVRDRLDDSGVPAVVLTRRDHAFNLNVSDLADVHVMIPPHRVDDALEILQSKPFTDEELNEAAMKADPKAPPAHRGAEDSMLNSGPNIAGTDEDEDDAS